MLWLLMKFLPSATKPYFAMWLRNELMNIYELAPQVIPIEPVLVVTCTVNLLRPFTCIYLIKHPNVGRMAYTLSVWE